MRSSLALLNQPESVAVGMNTPVLPFNELTPANAVRERTPAVISVWHRAVRSARQRVSLRGLSGLSRVEIHHADVVLLGVVQHPVDTGQEVGELASGSVELLRIRALTKRMSPMSLAQLSLGVDDAATTSRRSAATYMTLRKFPLGQ